MDLAMLARVIWRFRRLLIGGLLLAILLAGATYVKVTLAGGSPKLEYRQEQMWASVGRMLVTQPGFPQGRTDTGNIDTGAAGAVKPDARQFADPSKFVDLAMLYARIGMSSEVRQLVFPNGHPVKGFDSIAVTAQQDLPLVEVSTTANTRAGAVDLANREINALQTYIRREQRDNGVGPENRIELQVIEQPGAPAPLKGVENTWIIAPRSKMRPALVFVLICGLFFALALVLENINPRMRAVSNDDAATEDLPVKPSVRSA